MVSKECFTVKKWGYLMKCDNLPIYEKCSLYHSFLR